MKFKDAHEEYCSVLGGIMGSKEFEKACIKFVKDYTNKHMDKTDDKGAYYRSGRFLWSGAARYSRTTKAL